MAYTCHHIFIYQFYEFFLLFSCFIWALKMSLKTRVDVFFFVCFFVFSPTCFTRGCERDKLRLPRANELKLNFSNLEIVFSQLGFVWLLRLQSDSWISQSKLTSSLLSSVFLHLQLQVLTDAGKRNGRPVYRDKLSRMNVKDRRADKILIFI